MSFCRSLRENTPAPNAAAEARSAAALHVRSVASSAAACSGDGNSFTCTTNFTPPT
ncbi:hypothetical protein [Streptomyces meridianus]|uniref:Uncharacterized protein n=1 Tax=Streptomyces meridianus TaxID=2938945 RepID=A0ABT0X294_9ACTN|nr:hypothetical protein [Streptomyces meridianus]MCM2576657.1 hypothetical protein [Streptomyces meridianus]